MPYRTEVQRLSFVHFASRGVRHTGVEEGIRHSGLVLNLLYKESLELNMESGIFFFFELLRCVPPCKVDRQPLR